MTIATEQMQKLRAQRGKRLIPELREQKRRIDEWVQRRTEAVDSARVEANASARKPSPALEQKWRDQKRHTERVRDDRVAWMDRLKTSDQLLAPSPREGRPRFGCGAVERRVQKGTYGARQRREIRPM